MHVAGDTSRLSRFLPWTLGRDACARLVIRALRRLLSRHMPSQSERSALRSSPIPPSTYLPDGAGYKRLGPDTHLGLRAASQRPQTQQTRSHLTRYTIVRTVNRAAEHSLLSLLLVLTLSPPPTPHCPALRHPSPRQATYTSLARGTFARYVRPWKTPSKGRGIGKAAG